MQKSWVYDSDGKELKLCRVNRASVICEAAKVNLWLLGRKQMSATPLAIKYLSENNLDFYDLNYQTWCLLDGSV